MAWLRPIFVIAVLMGPSASMAAQLVPPSDQAGRERYRFTPSPLDRFLQPAPPAKPLLRWDCEPSGPSRAKPRSRRYPNC
jgi:hypothetical protein